MRTGELLSSLIHLMVVFCLCALGLSLIAIFYLPGLRGFLADILYYRPHLFVYAGMIVLSMSGVALIGFYLMHKTRYYSLKMGSSKTLIEESIIQDYVKRYWKGLFPDKRAAIQVIIGAKQQIEILTRLPSGIENREELFHRIENELGVLLARHLGYEKDFIFTIATN